MKEQLRQYIFNLLEDVASTDTHFVLLAILLVAFVIVLDAISRFARQERKKAGLNDETPPSERKSLQVKKYISEMQLLSGTPDALISEDGFIIPIERKPLAKKIRDRYIAQLLVYMRLVEEFEGKKPPYGYLVLGPKSRRIKIYNTEKRQAWLQKMIDEMQAVLHNEAQAKAIPLKQKCEACNVRHSCSHCLRVDEPEISEPSAALIECQTSPGK